MSTFTVERLARQCEGFADNEGKGYSPIYERLAREIAADDELLAWLTGTSDPRRMPVNLFAAVNYLARQQPEGDLARIYGGAPGDPWPAFRTFVDDHRAAVAETMATHTIQTNEVGRSAVLVPAMQLVASQFAPRPLALVEIGPSAGLNLSFDRYFVEYSDGRCAGDPHASVRLHCDVVGRPIPLPDATGFTIASRVGIDLAPVDVRDAGAVAWLEACIWPDVPHRLERLGTAVALAMSEPPRLLTGNALDLLVPTVDAIPGEHLPVVFATWALAYLSREDRLRVHRQLQQLGAQRDLALVTAEFPHVTPWLPESPSPTYVEKTATLLSVTTWEHQRERARPVAWTHAHGQWLEWFEPNR